jgi:hypothetical protein
MVPSFAVSSLAFADWLRFLTVNHFKFYTSKLGSDIPTQAFDSFIEEAII